ncbi:ACT domain-containing protein [Youngiibacter fragilis]|uniref:Amino acid-binding protein n=1 Tax=Youngiibacter fragilis 232.1 TaxID=994573 RepID=V7I687_9CLOT|nr:ACT domain-containing protein [Youngiibacter fragilis]ETA80811.1 amino acid-binding protein [Youngiibacter fragilis 232.1]
MGDAIGIELLAGSYGVARLEGGSRFPEWAAGEFITISAAHDELSVTCPEVSIPEGIRCERGWRVLKLIGPLDFALVGILAEISGILAEKKISIFAISTFDTDYILVKDDKVSEAVGALADNGFKVYERTT